MKRLLATLGTLVALAVASAPVHAQTKADPAAYQRADGARKTEAPARLAPIPTPPVAGLGGGTPVTLTQNASQDIVPLTGVACPGGGNFFYRVFDLSTFGVTAGMNVTSVDFGIEEVGTPTTATVRIYRLTGPFTLANLTLVGTSAGVPISSANNLSIVNAPVTGAFAGTDQLVVELDVPDGGFFPGANSAGQSGPTYVRATPCNVAEPTDLATLGFPDTHWVVNVRGTANPIAGPSLFANPGTVSFGRVPVGTTSETRTVTLTNNGTAGVTITSITGSGAPFAINTTGTDLTLDPGQSTTFTVTFSPTANGPTTGTVSIASNAPGSPITVNLSGEGFSPPPNDNRANATVIASAPASVTGTNLDATDEPDEPAPSCAPGSLSVWWVYTPATSGLLTVDLAGSDFDTVLTIHDASLAELGCNDDSNGTLQSRLANVPVAAGQPVYIRVTGFGGDQGNIALALTFTGGTIVTTNYAGDTTGDPTWARPTTVGSGTSGSCDISTFATATAYEALTFTVGTAGSYTITSTYAGWDGYLLLYQNAFNPADQCLNLIALNDDFNGTGQSRVEPTLAAGTYVLVTTGFSNTGFGPYTGTVVGPGGVVFTTAGEPGADAGTWLTVGPNPSASTATLRMATETAQAVTVALFDATGRRVATLYTGDAVPGQPLEIALDASALPAGVYVVRATGESLSLTQRLTVVR